MLKFACIALSCILAGSIYAAVDPEEVEKNRNAWYEMTKGANLARGKKVRLIPKPNYRLTTDAGDETDLTDGDLSAKSDDRIWFNKDSVGYYGGTDTALVVMDLGAVKPVDRMVVRALGGSSTGFKYPSSFEVLISKDGETWYSAALQTKLQPAEASQADFTTTFYYPEEVHWSDSTMKPFKLPIHADARYLILRVKMDKHFFSDEIAVIKSVKQEKDYNEAYQKKGMAFPLDGLSAHPRVNEIAVVAGVAAPQKFVVEDLRPQHTPIKKAVIQLELPEELSVYNFTGTPVQKNGKKYNRYTIELNNKLKMKEIYLLSSENVSQNLPDAEMYAEYDGQQGYHHVLPVKVVKLPVFKSFKKLPVCLAWMQGDSQLHSWPDFLKNYGRFGFNEMGVFPRWWIQSSRFNPAEKAKDLEKITGAGFRLVMNDSAFHEMMRGKKAGHEMFCQMNKPCKLVCPSYTGEFYKKEMDRITRCVAISKPQSVGLDIECFHHLKQAAKECKRCKAAIAASGKSADEFMKDCGTRQMKDISEAVAKGAKQAGIPVPELYMYGLEERHGVVAFNRVYPQYLKAAQPSLYVGGHPETVHETVSRIYKQLGKRDIIPWLSPGCYGELDSCLVEPIVLEAFMNGSCGIWYYEFGNFTDSPLDFYYHALAISKLVPYEELLINGKYGEIKGSNQKMFYSSVSNEKEALLLIGNYFKAAPETAFELPFSSVKSVKDLNSGKELPAAKSLKIQVPAGKFALIHVSGNK